MFFRQEEAFGKQGAEEDASNNPTCLGPGFFFFSFFGLKKLFFLK